MARIGFVSYWGFGRGRAMVTLCMAKMLQGTHDVFIMQEGQNDILEKEFELDIPIVRVPKYDPEPEVFKQWVQTNKLDAVVFNEYGQWTSTDNGLPELAKQLGLRVYGFLVYERFQISQPNRYDRIFVPSVTGERFMRSNRIRNFTYVPYSLDLTRYNTVTRKQDTFTFIHPGGFGGVHNRKNTELVVKAFEKINLPNTNLIITSQKPPTASEFPDRVSIVEKNLSHEELIGLIRECDAAVLPSKWETIGIPILESLAVGTPVITSDAPPMNEFVREGLNGMLCKANMVRSPDITMLTAEITVEELRKKMLNMINLKLNDKTGTFYPTLVSQSRGVIEKFYNIDKNKKYLLEFLEKDLQ